MRLHGRKCQVYQNIPGKGGFGWTAIMWDVEEQQSMLRGRGITKGIKSGNNGKADWRLSSQ